MTTSERREHKQQEKQKKEKQIRATSVRSSSSSSCCCTTARLYHHRSCRHRHKSRPETRVHNGRDGLGGKRETRFSRLRPTPSSSSSSPTLLAARSTNKPIETTRAARFSLAWPTLALLLALFTLLVVTQAYLPKSIGRQAVSISANDDVSGPWNLAAFGDSVDSLRKSPIRGSSSGGGGVKTAPSFQSSSESYKPFKTSKRANVGPWETQLPSGSGLQQSVKQYQDVTSSSVPLNNLANGFSSKRKSRELIDDSQGEEEMLSPYGPSSSQSSQLIPAARQTRQTEPSGKKCALILHRTYVRKLSNDIDNIESEVEPTGRAERVCITYENINEALEEAKKRRGFKLSNELMAAIQSIEPLPPYIAQIGELNLELVKVLKERFDLSPDEISEGLPLVDMSRTNFWPICPLMVKPIKCDPTGRFRSFTGHCNNLENPTWGTSQTPYVRYLPPRHPDGVEEFRRSVVDETPLPPVRLVSSMVHRDADQPSGDLSLFIMVFGQIVDHELTQAAPPRDENGLDFNCCKEPTKSEYCSPIRIPENDPLYRKYGQTCMDFKRSLVGLRPNCRLGPRVHINTITPTIDGNTIYGSTKAVSDQLRSFTGGTLKVQNVFKSLKMKPLLPRQTVRPDLDCFERPNNMFCFLAGDDRVNEQPTLTVMHTILVREHNRVASQLGKLNPHWNDDRIFHETRHLMAAKISTIVQTEYLPMLIGNQLMESNNLTSMSQSSYDPDIVPGIGQGFTTAAFRQGHTFIQGQLRLHDSRSFKFIESISLRHLFKRPFHYYNPGQIDKVLAGALNTPAQSYDPFITQEIAGHLFQEPGEEFGMDLISINLQRGREQGVPGYVAFRERFTRLPKVRSFDDLLTTMSNRTVYLYSRLYKSVHDIDLWSGGVSELPRDGALVGPTFAAIIGYQFSQIKNGDRFWYENGNQPSSFTSAQLREIKKFSLARLLCINSDEVQLIQRKALKLPHQIYNPLMSCKDLNDVDLRYWREDPNTPGQFFE